MELTVRIGMSACLTGQEVRYTGGHLNDSFLMGTFAKYVEWVPVCPEVEIGMGVPREEIRLTGNPTYPRLVGSRSCEDHTANMTSWAERRVTELASRTFMGYLKRDLSTEDKQEMLDLIEAYRMERLPLIVPLTLLRHHLNRNQVPEWVNQQVYLSPYPEELMLRNHV